MKFTGNARFTTVRTVTTAAALAAALLLTGCSSSDSDDGKSKSSGKSEGSKPESGPSGTTDPGPLVAARIDAARVVSVLPGDGDLPGWRISAAPSPYDLQQEPRSRTEPSCRGKATGWCKGALHTSTAQFNHPDAGTVEFTVHTYETAQAATAAHPALLTDQTQAELLPDGQQKIALPPREGEKTDAVRGTGKLRSPSVLSVNAVGTTVLTIRTFGLGTAAKTYTDTELAALTTLFSDRSRQTQKGTTPTARLQDDALSYTGPKS
ncbi:hypothetical protein ACH4E8_15990 [Streptomyces sp. NPDC017979]|uniref:hypothetical protein n=1 Tax=Streptomyces sp. NPDC017979 TaxID=3365024 RepID=UPI003789E878